MGDAWDIIVVGAGPAGTTLAIELATSGARTLLIDRARFPRDKLCGEFLSPECWPILRELQVEHAIRRSGYQPITQFRLWLPDDRCVATTLPQEPSRPAVGLSRARLDEILLRRAEAVGVSVMQGTEVVGVILQDGRVVGVTVRPVAGGARASSADRLHAGVVVAADGRHSTVVRESGQIRVRRSAMPGPVCAVKRHYGGRTAIEPGDAIELHSFPGGYAGTCRVESGLTNLCSLLPIALLRRARGNIDSALGEALGPHSHAARWLDEAEPVGDWKTVPEVNVQQARPERPGVLYVGDAMGTVDPLGGEGMAMAFQGAVLAAPVVRQAFRQPAGCDRALQLGYARAWGERFAQRIRFCQWFGWLLARPDLLARVLHAARYGGWSRMMLQVAFRATRGRSGRGAFHSLRGSGPSWHVRRSHAGEAT
jgi:flavin-dependent dehydrogenase